MLPLYLTPASISYLNQLLLALFITVFLARRMIVSRHKDSTSQDLLLVLFFASTTFFSLTLFLETSSLPSERLGAVYVEAPALALMLVALIQFAFTTLSPGTYSKTERYLALGLTSLYAAWEIGFAVWRFFLLLRQGSVLFRPDYVDFVLVVEFLWVVIIFGRGAVSNHGAPTGRNFALVFAVPVVLAIINLLVSYSLVSTTLYYISLSVGILVTLFLFTLIYLASRPETTSLMVRISGGILTVVLAVFGVIAWLVSPAYAARFDPGFLDHRTLHFSPNVQGGYDVAAVPYHFELEKGEKLAVANSTASHISAAAVDFNFRFYGQHYSQVFISDDGVLTFGRPFNYKDVEYRLSNVASIMALMIDLNPEISQAGGIFARRDANQLIITYDRLKALDYPGTEYTFQVVLHSDGSFDLNYPEIPRQQYYANDRPFSAIWVFGSKPAMWTRDFVSFSTLPLVTGPQGALQNQHLVFREYMNAFLQPLAGGVLVFSLLFLVGLPLVMYYSLTYPLNSLLKGVALLNEGHREVNIPVTYNDEIGYLTQSFNRMAAELNSLILGLESRVAGRTADLQMANEQLRKLSIAVEQNPTAILITDLDAKIEYTNHAFTLITEYTSEEVRGQNPRILQSGQTPQRVYEEMWGALKSGRTWRGELRNRKKNGELYWESTIIAPIRNAQDMVTHYVDIKEDITHRKLAEQAMEQLAITDPLTGLYNRRHFFSDAEQIFHRSLHLLDNMAALMLDIDHFKMVNDTFGHQAGDAVLREIALRIQDNLRPTDVLARYGGEEFVTLLPRTSIEQANLIADRLVKCIHDSPVAYGGVNISVTVSVGVASLDETVNSLDELLSHADQAMYQAKHQGRNTRVSWAKQPTP